MSKAQNDGVALGARPIPTPERARRSLLITAAGALIGLIIAGYALFTAKGTSTLAVPAEDVALVNQQPVARADYFAQIKATYQVDYPQATPEQRHKVLDDMIREELFVQRGKELDVAETDPDVRAAMVSSVEQMSASDVATRQPGESSLLMYYTDHQDRYSTEGIITALDLVFPDSIQAEHAAAALGSGALVAAVIANFHGRDSGKLNGEEFYFAARLHLGDALFDMARKLPNRGISKPVQQPDSVHLLYVLANKPPKLRSFDEARTAVLNDFRNDEIKRSTAQYQTFLTRRAGIQIAGDLQQ
jgi:parvulin-like peptidyl-prolyl isomerase